jgi:hypothetical protein
LWHRSEKLDRQRKPITHATFCLYYSGHRRVDLELAPEPKDLQVYATIKYVVVDAGRLQQLFTGQRALRRVKERGQQRVLTFS